MTEESEETVEFDILPKIFESEFKNEWMKQSEFGI